MCARVCVYTHTQGEGGGGVLHLLVYSSSSCGWGRLEPGARSWTWASHGLSGTHVLSSAESWFCCGGLGSPGAGLGCRSASSDFRTHCSPAPALSAGPLPDSFATAEEVWRRTLAACGGALGPAVCAT